MKNPFAQVAHYHQLSFVLPQGAAAQVEHVFDDMALAASAFEIDEENQRWRCELLFSTPPDMAEITRRVALLAAVVQERMPELTASIVAQQDWLSLVARQFPPLRIGRFFVHGSHATDVPPKSSILIQVEAGAAFGSGEHATTSTCLQALEWLARRRSPSHILDMGTGSGILAIAASQLWNAEILAVDIDPIAVEVAVRNVRINRVHKHIQTAVSDGYQSVVVKRFGACDLIIANILARPLVRFAPRLAATLQKGGYAILSGILTEQAQAVFAAHRMHGLKRVKHFTQNGWCTMIMQKR